MRRRNRELPLWLTLWVPVALVLSIPLARAVDPEFHARWFNRKEGPIEWLTVFVLLVGLSYGLGALFRRVRLPDPRLKLWLGLHLLAAFYIAGEEISWGQTVFGWESPELMERINGQQETNIHNTSTWFNEKPRLMFELWVLFAGIVLPLRRLRRGSEPSARGKWFWPTLACLPAAVCAIVLRLPDRFEKFVDKFETPFLADLRLSEPQELMFGYFLMLFLMSFAVRLRALELQPAQAAAPRDTRSEPREPESPGKELSCR